jgi:hypothetical protein
VDVVLAPVVWASVIHITRTKGIKTMKITKAKLFKLIQEELKAEGFFGLGGSEGTRTGIKAVMKNLKDSLTILEREGYDEAYDAVITAIEALEYPE